MADIFPLDEEYPAEDPGNQLRAKANGVAPPRPPRSFGEVLYTSCERGLLPFDKMEVDDAMKIVHLFFVAGAIDSMPGDEVARIRM